MSFFEWPSKATVYRPFHCEPNLHNLPSSLSFFEVSTVVEKDSLEMTWIIIRLYNMNIYHLLI